MSLALDYVRVIRGIDYVFLHHGRTKRIKVIGYLFTTEEYAREDGDTLASYVLRIFEEISRLQDVERAWLSVVSQDDASLDDVLPYGLYNADIYVDEKPYAFFEVGFGRDEPPVFSIADAMRLLFGEAGLS